MKVGVLFCCYGVTPKFAEAAIAPWLTRTDTVISVCSSPFAEYKDIGLTHYDYSSVFKDCDYVWKNDEFNYNEAFVRSIALEPLIEEECDIVWLLDADEFYTTDQIENILAFVEEEEFTAWFGVNFKNYVFDVKHYYSGFCPPRIFRTDFKGSLLDKLHFDNDFHYEKDGEVFDYKDLPHMKIPSSEAFVRHITWLSNEESKRKIQYHHKHFGPDKCSFKWNDEEDRLEFNEAFYARYKEKMPVVQVEK